MVSFLRVITFLSIFSCFSCSAAFSAVLPNDRASIPSARNQSDKVSLLEFKAQITQDPLGILSFWNASNPFCMWHGVTCGKRHRRVVSLRLGSTRLAGTLSPHIGNLSFLRILDLQNNSFRGVIPQQVTQLFRLRLLGLTNNTLSGMIPTNLSSCLNLRILDVEGNLLIGKIPNELGPLQKLEIIKLGHNSISGVLPSFLGNYSSLTRFSAGHTRLHGFIPESFGKMRKLKILLLARDNLKGAIPSSLYNITSLKVLDVGSNNLEGVLPPKFGIWLPNIEFLNLYRNHFEGAIPVTISNASKLSVLELGRNKFWGGIPSLRGLRLRIFTLLQNNLGYDKDGDLNFICDIANRSVVEALVSGSNNLGGIFPRCIGNLSTKLRILGFEDNNIRGSMPTGIGNLMGLEWISLAFNRFSGEIPSSTCKMKMLKRISFSANNISGEIPSCFGNLTSLLNVNLGSNRLRRRIPASLGSCRGLNTLDLSKNMLNGSIPKEILSIPSLVEVLLSHNRLIGSIPIEGKLLGLGLLDLSNNVLSGEIPGALGGCSSLVKLQLQANLFHGRIPPNLSSLQAIQYLDISQNKLFGRVPEFLGNLNLHHLNLSFNDFQGAIPLKGVFKNASAVFLSGNGKLCGGIPALHLPRCLTKKAKQKGKPWIKLTLFIVLGTFLLMVMLGFFVLRRLKNARRKASTTDPRPIGSVLQLSYADLFNATAGFSSDNLIGQGSFGSVYKGIIEKNAQAEHRDEPGNQVVAVKVFDLLHLGSEKSFFAECEVLRRIRHRNLVRIVTACSSTDFRGNDFKALIYEFMENGSLEDWLHPSLNLDQSAQTFGLLQRLNISADVACALEYLHHQTETPVAHCDLKPSNILLDVDMTAHLGDFGLARLLREEGDNQEGITNSSSIGYRGTIGYTPPEYGTGDGISIHGDIYSYGILLFELFTGIRPTDEAFGEGQNLRDFVKAAIPQDLKKILDPVLLKEEAWKVNNQEKSLQCLLAILEIGLRCSAEVPKDRMDMTVVVAEVKAIRKKFQGLHFTAAV